MKVAQAYDVNRYNECAVPRWLGVDIEPHEQNTSHLNSILALFHYN